MKKLFFLGLLLLPMGLSARTPLSVLEDDADRAVQKVIDYHRYNIDLKLVTKEVHKIFLDPESSIYYRKRYQPVLEGHKALLKDIREFYDLNSKISEGSFADLSQKVALIESYSADIMGKYRDYYNRCSAYQNYLGLLRSDLDVFISQINDYKPLIDNQEARNFGDRVVEDIKKWKDFTKELEDANKKRIDRIAKIVPKMQSKAKQRLIASYNAWATDQINKIDSATRRAFKVDRLMGRAFQVSNGFSLDQELSYALDRYYNYDTAVARLNHHKVIAEDLSREFYGIVGLTDTQKGLVGMMIDPVVKTLNDQLDELRVGGWESMYTKQKDIFATGVQYPDMFSDDCVRKFKKFLDASITSYTEYLDWFPVFKTTYKECLESGA